MDGLPCGQGTAIGTIKTDDGNCDFEYEGTWFEGLRHGKIHSKASDNLINHNYRHVVEQLDRDNRVEGRSATRQRNSEARERIDLQ